MLCLISYLGRISEHPSVRQQRISNAPIKILIPTISKFKPHENPRKPTPIYNFSSARAYLLTNLD